MKIKKLEVCGFKSFVDRTVLHFDHEVTCIVGPNGCGKSNIVDAIRWAMGEQSAKTLRGRGMDDVIFAGAESRGRGRLRRGHDHVRQQRPASRRPSTTTTPRSPSRAGSIATGNSEYLINKTQVRLMDVTEPVPRHRRRPQVVVLDRRAGPHRLDRLGQAARPAHADRRGRRHHQVQGQEDRGRAQDGIHAAEPAARRRRDRRARRTRWRRSSARRRRPSATRSTATRSASSSCGSRAIAGSS